MSEPNPRPAVPRRRSPEQASGMASALFQSFAAPLASASPSAPAAEAPIEPAASATVAPVPDPVSELVPRALPPQETEAESPASTPQTRAVALPSTPERTRTASRAGDRSARTAPPHRSAPMRPAPDEEVTRPGRPSRPRLAEPTPYATKHRNVRSARIQALLRESDLDVLDEVARLTQIQTGEETNRSELLRALVEGLAAAGATGEMAECGTHRARVAFLAERLRG